MVIDILAYMSQTVPVTYDPAPTKPLWVSSDKTILGVGDKGKLIGKGLLITYAKNIIIQNIFITKLNEELLWGGRCIDLSSRN